MITRKRILRRSASFSGSKSWSGSGSWSRIEYHSWSGFPWVGAFPKRGSKIK